MKSVGAINQAYVVIKSDQIPADDQVLKKKRRKPCAPASVHPRFPRESSLLTQLPQKTPSGKIQRFFLRDRARGRDTANES